MRPFNIPPDLLHLIFQNLSGHRDRYACALVNRTFNAIVTPLLYRELECRPFRVYEPLSTLLSRPELAKYVRHITEHGSTPREGPESMPHTIKAISFCTHLNSFEWDDTHLQWDSNIVLISIIEAIRVLPVKELVICTVWELDDRVWQLLPDLHGLRKLTLSCGAPRVPVLREWAGKLGETLTQLRLSCLDVDTTTLTSVFSQLPLLRYLWLEYAPTEDIPTLLTHLPNICSFQADYLGDDWDYHKPDRALPVLKSLIVDGQASGVDNYDRIWDWVLELVARPNSLEVLEASMEILDDSLGQYEIERTPIMKLSELHGKMLRSLTLNVLLKLEDLVFVCDMFSGLEQLEISMRGQDPGPVMIATSSAKKLRIFFLHFFPPFMCVLGILPQQFTIHDAREVMMRSHSIRTLGINGVHFEGKWVMKDGQLEFVAIRTSRA